MAKKEDDSLAIPLRKVQKVAEWVTILIVFLGSLYANQYYPHVYDQIDKIFIVAGLLLLLILWKVRISQDKINLLRFAVLFMFSFLLMNIIFNIIFGVTRSVKDFVPQNSVESIGYFFYGSYIWVRVLFPFLRLLSLLENKNSPLILSFLLTDLSLGANLLMPNSMILFLGYTVSLLIPNLISSRKETLTSST